MHTNSDFPLVLLCIQARKQIMGRDAMVFGTEFQTAAEMYKRLKSLLRKNARLNYQACHSIVADPECSHGKRATLVARDIEKVADVPFEYVEFVKFQWSGNTYAHSVSATKSPSLLLYNLKVSIPCDFAALVHIVVLRNRIKCLLWIKTMLLEVTRRKTFLHAKVKWKSRSWKILGTLWE